LRHYATSLKVMGSILNEVNGSFTWPNPSSCTMVLVSTQPLPEMSTRNLPRGKGRLAHKADNLTIICEPTVQKMWELRCLTTLWASMTYYRDDLPLSSQNWTIFCEIIITIQVNSCQLLLFCGH
jgi:hypothetical protein